MKKIVKLQDRKILNVESASLNFFINKSQKGVTLIEVMVALLIFSVGALGLAAMQLTALSSSGDNQQRTVAIWKAQEFANRIRSNPDARATYETQIGNQNLNNSIGADSQANIFACNNFPQPGTRCDDTPGAGASACTSDQRVDYDIWEVFCEPNTGVATVGGAGANANGEGSVGLTNLEVALIDNQAVAGAGSDMLLYFEWVSREADGSATGSDNLAGNGQAINTNLCGANVAMASSLDAYCLRFNPF